jgi:hypothetical protein
MSHCVLIAELGGEEHQFALYLGQWEELQERLGFGPLEIFDKLSRLQFRANWLREITRLGLIGGGMSPGAAKRLVERYVDSVPFAEAWPLAFQIVARSCYRPNEEAQKKIGEILDKAAEEENESSFGQSTETVQ